MIRMDYRESVRHGLPLKVMLMTLHEASRGNAVQLHDCLDRGKNVNKLLSSVFAIVTTLILSTSVNASLYNFSQIGYTGGGVINGSFDAIDTDLNGQISSFSGEVTGFSMTFLGDSIVGSFTHTFSDLSGLVYDIGSGFIGDETSPDTEGLASNWFGFSGFIYVSDMGPTGGFGGRVIDIATGATSSSQELITVTAVPEPETYAMFMAGLGLLGFIVRRRKNGQA
jgi:hypothetical protein